jgi:hypothetical protein
VEAISPIVRTIDGEPNKAGALQDIGHHEFRHFAQPAKAGQAAGIMQISPMCPTGSL